ncbi:hypothetical protein GCM10027053_46410 [Intrasporangium mesophilum]
MEAAGMSWNQYPSSKAIYRRTSHKLARARAVKAFRPGDPCALCGRPMWPARNGSLSHLHLDHDPSDPTRQRYRGLVHAKCNASDAGRRARAKQVDRDAEPATPRRPRPRRARRPEGDVG